MTDTGVVDVVAPNTSVVLLNPTDHSIFLRKGGTVGVLQSGPRIEVFKVSDGNLSREGYVESGQVFSKPAPEQLPKALDKLPSEQSAELNLSQTDAVRATLWRYSGVFAPAWRLCLSTESSGHPFFAKWTFMSSSNFSNYSQTIGSRYITF